MVSCEEIREMSAAEQDAIFRSLTTDTEREQFKDALVNPLENHRSGIHSECSDTRRRRNHKNELEIFEDKVPSLNAVEEHELQQMLLTLARDGLSQRQKQVWFLYDYMGYSQREIANLLGIKQPAVSRVLHRAEDALMERAMMDGVALHLLRESGRRGYFAPGHRPGVPELVQEHRRVIEMKEGVITVIIDMDKQAVEIWDTNQPDVIRDKRRLPDGRVGFRKAARIAANAKL